MNKDILLTLGFIKITERKVYYAVSRYWEDYFEDFKAE